MTLAMPQVQVGAIVEECFDDTLGKKYGSLLKIRRRGVIERVMMSSEAEYNDGSDIREIWVRFHKDRPAEKIANARLALFRGYDAGQAEKIRNRANIELAEDILSEKKSMARAEEDDGPTLVIDQTGIEKGARISEHNIDEQFTS